MNLPETFNTPERPQGDSLMVAHRGRPPAIPAQNAAADRLDFRALSDVLRRRALIITATFLAFLGLAFVITKLQTPVYSARADMLIEADAAVTPGSREEAPVNVDNASYLETRMQILKSRGLMESVVTRLNLHNDRNFLGLPAEAEMPAAPEAKRIAVDRLLGKLKVERLQTSNVVSITVSDTNPDRAAAFANMVARAYILDSIGNAADLNEEAISILRGRVEELRQDAQARTEAVQRYRISNNLLSRSATSLTEQEISAANQQIALARAEAAEAQSRLNAARAQLTSGGTEQVGEAAATPVIQTLRSQRATLSARLTDLEGRYLPTHPDVMTGRAQLADLDRQIVAEVDRTLKALEGRAAASQGRLASLLSSVGSSHGTLAANNQSLVGLDDLERQAQASQALYDSYLNRYKEVVARSGAEQADARVISAADVPKQPTGPKMALNLALGGVLGLLAGMGLALLAEMSFAGLTTAEDVEKRLGVRSFGGIPQVPGDPLAAITDEPGGLFAESLRGLLTAIRAGEGRRQVIAFVSALPGEGKTTLASAAARTAALAGLRVVVIDGDAVQAGLSRLYALDPGRAGLLELLAGSAGYADVVHRDPVGGAEILGFTGEPRPGDRLMADGSLQRLVAGLRETHDLILIDSSPLLPIAEAREIAGVADTVVMVARWRKTADTAVLSALKLLPWTAISDIGVVLNLINLKRLSRFGRSDAISFYRHYQGHYG